MHRCITPCMCLSGGMPFAAAHVQFVVPLAGRCLSAGALCCCRGVQTAHVSETELLRQQLAKAVADLSARVTVCEGCTTTRGEMAMEQQQWTVRLQELKVCTRGHEHSIGTDCLIVWCLAASPSRSSTRWPLVFHRCDSIALMCFLVCAAVRSQHPNCRVSARACGDGKQSSCLMAPLSLRRCLTNARQCSCRHT